MYRLLLKLWRRRRLERDLEAELAFHREMAAAHNNPVPLGNTAAIQEQARDLWRFTLLENLWRDVVYGLRGLRANPALVAGALLSLGLGIGANATIFSLGVAFLLSQPSVSDPSSLVAIRVGGSSHSSPEVVRFIAESGLFASVAGGNDENTVNLDDGTTTRAVFAVSVTRNYFTALGVPVAHGRGILPSDPDEVAVLRHSFWLQQFGGDPAAVGRILKLNGRVCTVIGILPEDHRTVMGFGYAPDLYLPQYLPETRLAVTARLKPGMTLAEARAGMAAVTVRLDEAFPERWKRAPHTTVVPLAGFARLREERKTLMTFGVFFALLLGVAALVLLIACVNVAGLLLARAAARRQEFAIRLSLGAGRGRLLQQMLVESLLLSLGGAAAGLAMAHATAQLLAAIRLPLPIPVRLQVEPDWRLWVYAASLTAFATIACGLLPALQSIRESLAGNLRRESRLRLRRGLVVAQVALSLIVLATGSLFLRNLMLAGSISPGFDVHNTLRAQVHLPPGGAYTRDPRRLPAFFVRSIEALRAIPGIELAAAVHIVPFTDATRNAETITIAGSGEKVPTRYYWNAVTADYFRAMGIRLREGAAFTGREAEKVVVVNTTFAERYLGTRRAVGTVFLGGAMGTTPYRIVGVAEPTKNITIGEDPVPQLFQPLEQVDSSRLRLQFVLRSAVPPALQVEAVRRALRSVEPAAAVEVGPMASSIGMALLPSQVGAGLLGSIGILGLLLAAVGLYGVMVYTVARRTREIGVRLAIGASGSDIRRMVLADSARLLAMGAAIGLAAALLATRPLAMFLVPGLQPADPTTFAAVIAMLGFTGLAAAWGPARRAAAVDPMRSLRVE